MSDPAAQVPVSNYPELAVLDESDLQSLSLGFGGSALCLEARDLHVSIAGLVSDSQPLMDTATSLVAVAMAENAAPQNLLKLVRMDAKGGHPKLALAG